MVVTRTEVQTVSPQIPLLLFLCAQMTQKKHEILQKKNKNTMEQGFNHLLQRLHVPVCAHLMPFVMFPVRMPGRSTWTPWIPMPSSWNGNEALFSVLFLGV